MQRDRQTEDRHKETTIKLAINASAFLEPHLMFHVNSTSPNVSTYSTGKDQLENQI